MKSEYDVFVECIPMIAEMVVECSKMSRQDYEEWKCEVMEAADDNVKRFVEKVLICMDKYVLKKDGGCHA